MQLMNGVFGRAGASAGLTRGVFGLWRHERLATGIVIFVLFRCYSPKDDATVQ